MPTLEHNALVEMFRENPELAPHFLALLFGVCAVVEYLGGFNGVGRVLRIVTFSFEVRQLVAITFVSTALLLLLQSVLRNLVMEISRLL